MLQPKGLGRLGLLRCQLRAGGQLLWRVLCCTNGRAVAILQGRLRGSFCMRRCRGLFFWSWLPPASASPQGDLLSFVVFGSVVCSPPAFRVSISGCRMFDMWTVTILICDVWTLHSRSKADCSTQVSLCSTDHLQMMMRACVSRLCWHVSSCGCLEGLLCRCLTEGCTKRLGSSNFSQIGTLKCVYTFISNSPYSKRERS